MLVFIFYLTTFLQFYCQFALFVTNPQLTIPQRNTRPSVNWIDEDEDAMSEGETFAGIEEKYFRKRWILRLDLKVSHISI